MAYLVYDKEALDRAGIKYVETVYVLSEEDVETVFEGVETGGESTSAWAQLTEEQKAAYMRAAEKGCEYFDFVTSIQEGFRAAGLPYSLPTIDEIDDAFNVNYSDRWSDDEGLGEKEGT